MYWLLALLLTLLVVYVALRPSTKSNLPDGPRVLLNEKDRRTKLHLYLALWAKTYGDFFSYRIGHSTAIVLSSMQAIEELLIKKGHIYSSRPTSSSQADIITGKARIVNMPYGEEFRKHRKIIHTLLGIQNAKIFLPYQEYESRQTLRNLLHSPDLFYSEMSRYSASVTFSLLVGARFDRSDAFLPTIIGEMMQKFFNTQDITPGAWVVDLYPFLDYLPGFLAPWRSQAYSIHRELRNFWNVFFHSIEERVKEGTAPDCFLSRFIQDPESQHLSEIERITVAAELLTAGTETTATTLQWFFKVCAIQSEWIPEAQKELDTVVGRDRLPDFSDRESLPYITAVVSELHRWASVTPLAFFHATSQDDTYRGTTIAKSTVVIPNTYAVHHSDEYFANSSAFLPGRWLSPEDPRHVHDGAKTANHLAFGLGRRECPGKHVADSSLFIVISRILWAFDIERDNPPPSDETGCAPFKCRITPRSEDAARNIRRFADHIDPGLHVEDGSTYDAQVQAVLSQSRI
ncbi:Cytochrome P450 family protein [Fonsecaea pedrosoi]|nr:Cytochrome P450 family protein [Fonsecaea pedrosoi]